MPQVMTINVDKPEYETEEQRILEHGEQEAPKELVLIWEQKGTSIKDAEMKNALLKQFMEKQPTEMEGIEGPETEEVETDDLTSILEGFNQLAQDGEVIEEDQQAGKEEEEKKINIVLEGVFAVKKPNQQKPKAKIITDGF